MTKTDIIEAMKCCAMNSHIACMKCPYDSYGTNCYTYMFNEAVAMLEALCTGNTENNPPNTDN